MPFQAAGSFAPGDQARQPVPKGPVVPVGWYRHPNGSIAYVYPSDVVEKYKSEHKDGQKDVSNQFQVDAYPNQAAYKMPQPMVMAMYPGVYPSGVAQGVNKPFAHTPYPVSHTAPGTSSPTNYANAFGQEGGQVSFASSAAVGLNGALNSLGMSGMRTAGFVGTSPQSQQLPVPMPSINAYPGYVPGPQYAPFHYSGGVDASQHAYGGTGGNGYGMMPSDNVEFSGGELGGTHQA
jgi:hypothetical protein